MSNQLQQQQPRVIVLFDGWKTFSSRSNPCPDNHPPRVLEVTLVEHCASDVIEIIPFDTSANMEAQRLYVTRSSLKKTLLDDDHPPDNTVERLTLDQGIKKEDEKTRIVNFILCRLQYLDEKNHHYHQPTEGEGEEEEGKRLLLLSPTTRWRTQLIPKRTDRIDPIHGWLMIQCHKPLDIQNICVKRDKRSV